MPTRTMYQILQWPPNFSVLPQLLKYVTIKFCVPQNQVRIRILPRQFQKTFFTQLFQVGSSVVTFHDTLCIVSRPLLATLCNRRVSMSFSCSATTICVLLRPSVRPQLLRVVKACKETNIKCGAPLQKIVAAQVNHVEPSVVVFGDTFCTVHRPLLAKLSDRRVVVTVQY